MELSPDHARRLESLIRPGVISEIDHAAARCRVTTGGLTTDWLPWISRRAGATRDWNPPTQGEQVLVVSPSGETGAGFVILGIYSDANPAPSSSPDEHLWLFPDGARILYNHKTGALQVSGVKLCSVESASIVLRGSVTIDGPVTQTGGALSSNGVVLDKHRHRDVTPGSDPTGVPL